MIWMQLIILSIKGQLFRPAYLHLMRFHLNDLPDHHLQPANFAIVYLIEVVYQFHDIEPLEFHSRSVVGCKGAHHYLVIDYVVGA